MAGGRRAWSLRDVVTSLTIPLFSFVRVVENNEIHAYDDVNN